MRRPLLPTLLGALLSLVLLLAFSAWLLSRNVAEARRAADARMLGLAAYIGERLAEDPAFAPAPLGPHALPEPWAGRRGDWLARLTQATGLERAVLADSAGTVLAASLGLLQVGDDIAPFLLDTALYAAAARDGAPRFTALAEIDGVHFQSLYHPLALGGRRHLVVLESDQNVMASVEQFRAYLVLASLFLLAVFALLSAGLLALDRQARAALAESRRNERLAFLGRTSAELAHEIRNPLGIIKSSVDVLRRKYDPARTERAFDFISEEVMRLSRLIGNILGLSRDRPLAEEPFRPREVLDALAAAHAQDLPGVAWAVDVPPAAVVIGDADAFRLAADNLARNAAAAMGGQGRFSVSASAAGKGGAWRLRFADTGPGLPPAVRARLFEPFVSGSRAGTGLGLSIVRSLCARAGWEVRLLSDAADGRAPTCFAIDIPAARVREAA